MMANDDDDGDEVPSFQPSCISHLEAKDVSGCGCRLVHLPRFHWFWSADGWSSTFSNNKEGPGQTARSTVASPAWSAASSPLAVVYFASDDPFPPGSLLYRLVHGDDAFRNSRFKIVNRIVRGSSSRWVVLLIAADCRMDPTASMGSVPFWGNTPLHAMGFPPLSQAIQPLAKSPAVDPSAASRQPTKAGSFPVSSPFHDSTTPRRPCPCIDGLQQGHRSSAVIFDRPAAFHQRCRCCNGPPRAAITSVSDAAIGKAAREEIVASPTFAAAVPIFDAITASGDSDAHADRFPGFLAVGHARPTTAASILPAHETKAPIFGDDAAMIVSSARDKSVLFPAKSSFPPPPHDQAALKTESVLPTHQTKVSTFGDHIGHSCLGVVHLGLHRARHDFRHHPHDPSKTLTTGVVRGNRGFLYCSLSNSRHYSHQVFDKIPHRHVVSWTDIIEACDSVSFLSTCSEFSALNMGRLAHSCVVRMGMELTAIVGTVLIDVYCRCGCIEDALAVFDLLPEMGDQSWNAMLQGPIASTYVFGFTSIGSTSSPALGTSDTTAIGASGTSANPAASIGLHVDCGSIYVTPMTCGATHLLDRMAFKSTANRSHLRILHEVEAIDGNTAASDSHEHMEYSYDALKTYVPQMVEGLVDTVRKPVFLDWEVHKKLQQVKTEITEMSNNPPGLLLEAIHTARLSGALENPLLAPASALTSLDGSILEMFVDENYIANPLDYAKFIFSDGATALKKRRLHRIPPRTESPTGGVLSKGFLLLCTLAYATAAAASTEMFADGSHILSWSH